MLCNNFMRLKKNYIFVKNCKTIKIFLTYIIQEVSQERGKIGGFSVVRDNELKLSNLLFYFIILLYD